MHNSQNTRSALMHHWNEHFIVTILLLPSFLRTSSSRARSRAREASTNKKWTWPSTVSKKLGEKLRQTTGRSFYAPWICTKSERRYVPHPCKYSDGGLLQAVCSLASASVNFVKLAFDLHTYLDFSQIHVPPFSQPSRSLPISPTVVHWHPRYCDHALTNPTTVEFPCLRQTLISLVSMASSEYFIGYRLLLKLLSADSVDAVIMPLANSFHFADLAMNAGSRSLPCPPR